MIDRHMLKINTSVSILTAIASICFFISCSKQDNGKNLPEATVKTDSGHSQSLNYTLPGKDTINAIIKRDSLRELKQKEMKRKNDSLKSLKETEVKILAYYFHPTARCATCRNIEAYSYEAIQQWEEKNKKKIIWMELNIEDSVNEHYAEEYNLQFSSLIIVKYVGGKKDKWKILEETWKLVNDKVTFIKYVIYELNRFIKEKSN